MDHLPLPAGIDKSCFDVPFVASLDYDGQDFDEKEFTKFPERHNFRFDGDGESRPVEETAALVQSWLYFGLIGTILQKPFDKSIFRIEREGLPGSFVSSKPLVDLDLPFFAFQDEKEAKEEPAGMENPYVGVEDTGEVLAPDDLFEWIHQQTDNPAIKKLERMLPILEAAEKKFFELDAAYKFAAHPLPVVLMSVRVLVDTLRFAFLGARMQNSTKKARNEVVFAPVLGDTATTILLGGRMLENGWCPIQIREMFARFVYPVIHYAAHVRRFQPRGVHAVCVDSPGAMACVAFNINPDTYVTLHETEGCECEFIEAPVLQTRSIIENGGIPIMRTVTDRAGKMSLKVKKSTVSDNYVAFSHVWSDGLGNRFSNSLPRCRLERLNEHLDRLERMAGGAPGTEKYGASSVDGLKMRLINHKTRDFWIDTLCIPTAPPEDADMPHVNRLRKMAINNIAPTFVGALRIIILDAEMGKFLPKVAGWTETALRLVFSTWMGRCWTLEEGGLARACQVQCADNTIFNPNAMTEDRSKAGYLESIPYSNRRLAKQLWGLIEDCKRRLSRWLYPPEVDVQKRLERAERAERVDRRIRRMVDIPLERFLDNTFQQEQHLGDGARSGDKPDDRTMQQLRTCWDDLAARSSSRLEDRLLILSNMMGLNTFAVDRLPSPMMSLLRSMPGVPLSLLYNPVAKSSKRAPRAREGAPARNSDDYTTIDVYNRWLPDYPGSFRLGSEGWMKWDGDYYLHYPNRPAHTEFIYFPNPKRIFKGDPHSDFLVKEGRKVFRYQVEYLRNDKRDTIGTSQFIAFCLVIGRDIDRNRSEVFGGAYLHVTSKTADKMADLSGVRPLDLYMGGASLTFEITAVYDCPVRIQRTALKLGEFEATPEQKSQTPLKLSLKLCHDCPEQYRFDQRLKLDELILFPTLLAGIAAMPSATCNLLSYCLFLVITVKSFSASLPIMVILVIALNHITRWFQVVQKSNSYAILLDLAVTMAYGYIKATFAGPLSGPDRWFVGLGCVGQAGTLITEEGYRRLVAPGLYQEWVSGFGPNPDEDATMKWTRRTRWTMKKLDQLFRFVLENVLRRRRIPQ